MTAKDIKIIEELKKLDTSQLSKDEQVLTEMMGIVFLMSLNEEFQKKYTTSNPQTPSELMAIAISCRTLDADLIAKAISLESKVNAVSKEIAKAYFINVLKAVPHNKQNLFSSTKQLLNCNEANETKKTITKVKPNIIQLDLSSLGNDAPKRAKGKYIKKK